MIKLKIFLTIILALNFSLTFAKDNEKYRIDKITPGILKGADAVIRHNITEFEIKDRDRAILNVKKVITIFNKKKQDYGNIVLHYDKFIKIKDLDAKIYDAFGKEIKKLKSSDIEDFSGVDGYTLFDDSRLKVAELKHHTFPYTIEIEYKLLFDGYINWPKWEAQENLDAVEQTKFKVTINENYLRYHVNSDSVKPYVYNDGNNKVYVWEEINLPKLSEDYSEQEPEDYTSVVRIAPVEFEIAGYKGNMSSWQEFGSWFGTLSKDRNILPQEAINEIHNLISENDTKAAKIEKLYKYLQSRTRYISVQLGIGGWQPFPADYVHQKGYGDCKALSNYMVSILNEAGISAYPTLIKNGSYSQPIISDFPSNQFNHVIVCVPLEKDSIWLECTSQNMPAGSIGYSNENRQALLITPGGGKLVSTPRKNYEQNIQNRITSAKIDSDGNVRVITEVNWTGNQADFVRGRIAESTPKEQEKWIINFLEIKDIRLHNFIFNGIKETEINLTLNADLPRYASKSGKRLFIKPSIIEKKKKVPDDISERISPVRFNFPYLDVDTVKLEIPEGYIVEALPNEIQLTESFGSFSAKFIINSKSILFIRKIQMNDYSIPAENYREYRKFISDIVKSDRSQIVLIKN